MAKDVKGQKDIGNVSGGKDDPDFNAAGEGETDFSAGGEGGGDDFSGAGEGEEIDLSGAGEGTEIDFSGAGEGTEVDFSGAGENGDREVAGGAAGGDDFTIELFRRHARGRASARLRQSFGEASAGRADLCTPRAAASARAARKLVDHRLAHSPDAEWFEQPLRDAVIRNHRLMVARHDEDGDAGAHGAGVIDEQQPRTAGHPDVGDHRVKVSFPQQVDRRLDIDGRRDIEIVEGHLQQFKDSRLVVDEKQPAPGAHEPADSCG